MELSQEIKQMLDENIIYLATSTTDGKPNVVPVGYKHAINDDEILIVDVLFNRTRSNLEINNRVAISFTDMKRAESYQIKGNATIYTEGDIFQKAVELRKEIEERKREEIRQRTIRSQETDNDLEREKEKRRATVSAIRTKAAVVITVEEIYSNVYRPKQEDIGL